jgi:hypothetical protein
MLFDFFFGTSHSSIHNSTAGSSSFLCVHIINNQSKSSTTLVVVNSIQLLRRREDTSEPTDRLPTAAAENYTSSDVVFSAAVFCVGWLVLDRLYEDVMLAKNH